MSKNDLQADASFLEAVDEPLVDLHKSNILKLEIDELLDECRLDVQEISWATNAKDYVALLSSVLSKLPQTPVKKDGCPFTLRSEKVTSVEMPQDLTIVPTGSYAVNCLTKKSGNANVLPTLDCAIVVPDSYWHAKDYLNHRYMDKRNIILWSIAKLLSGKKFKKHVGTVEWRNFNGNEQTPALILTPPLAKANEKKKRKTTEKSQTVPKFTVQLVMAMNSLSWIPAPRMFPNRSNVKGGAATPYYNSILARDAFWKESSAMIMEDVSELPSFRDTLVVTKIWCLQRGFLRGHDSLDEMQLAVLLLYLYRTKRVSPRMAPLQAFTILMKFFAEEWTNKVMIMPEQGKNETQTVASCENAKAYATQAKESPLDTEGDPATLVQCHQQFSSGAVVLLNSAMLGNHLGTLSPAYCACVSLQARKTVACLNSTRSFSTLFMTNARFWTCLDSYFHVPLKDVAWKRAKLWGKHVHDLGEVECLSRDLVSILRRALGDRVTDVRVLTTGNGHDVHNGDPDQIPTHGVDAAVPTSQSFSNSMDMEKLVVGVKINIDNCHRAVDRGPPADDTDGVKAFLDLWGDAAELRRFKDGAIVHAVVWNTPKANPEEQYVVFDGDERTQGGIVERIIQHVVGLHFCREGRGKPQFLLRDMLAMVDGVRTPTADTVSKLMSNSTLAHRSIINSFDSLAVFLRNSSEQSASDGRRSPLGLPLQIDGVEALSPSLRYSTMFPAIPHPLLGGNGSQAGKVTGVISYAPIQIQIRFGRSSKWPTDLKAMGAAKTAMLAQLADGIEAMKKRGKCNGFEGPIVVTPFHLTLGYQGYSWRIVVRADPELYLLRGLQKPSDDALLLLKALTREHITAASHHATIHGIHTSHPSAGHVVRLFNNWLATHMLSGLIPFEAVELLVAKVYSDKESPIDAPATVVSGFMRVLRLVATYDWVRNPLVVDPQGHLTDDDHSRIQTRFAEDRGPGFNKGPSMYIIAPYDCKDLMNEDPANSVDQSKQRSIANFASWKPTYTQATPERVTLFRTAALAKRSYSYLLECLTDTVDGKWTAAFRETQTSLKSFALLLRVDSNFVVDTAYSSTREELVFKASSDGHLESMFSRSARNRYEGPKALRRKMYRNLNSAQTQFLLHDWRPLEETINVLRRKLGRYALFFYNELAPEVIAVLWRPSSFQPKVFTAVNSESVRPAEDNDWKSDSLAMDNVKDFMREMNQTTRDIVVDVKVFDDRSPKRRLEMPAKARKRNIDDVSDSGSEDSGSDKE